MGVGLNVPYWVGSADGDGFGEAPHVIVRIEPPHDLKTLTTKDSKKLTTRSLEAGRSATLRRLGPIFGQDVSAETKQKGAAPVPPHEPFTLPSLAAAAIAVVSFVIVAWLSFTVLRSAVQGRIGWASLVGLVVVGAVMVGLHALGRVRRAFRAKSGFRALPRSVLVGMVLVGGLFTFGIGAAVFSREPAEIEPPMSTRLAAVELEGVVAFIDEPSDDAWGAAVNVIIPDEVARRADRVEQGTGLVDTNANDVGPCSDEVKLDEGQACYAFLSDRDYQVHDEVKVRFSKTSDVLFLQDELFASAWLMPFLVGLTLGLAMVTLRAMMALRRPEGPQEPSLTHPPAPAGASSRAPKTVLRAKNDPVPRTASLRSGSQWASLAAPAVEVDVIGEGGEELQSGALDLAADVALTGQVVGE